MKLSEIIQGYKFGKMIDDENDKRLGKFNPVYITIRQIIAILILLIYGSFMIVIGFLWGS